MDPTMTQKDLSLLQLDIQLSRKGAPLMIITHSERVYMQPTTYTYPLESVTKCDSGEYICTATIFPQTPSPYVTGNGTLTGRAVVTIGKSHIEDH